MVGAHFDGGGSENHAEAYGCRPTVLAMSSQYAGKCEMKHSGEIIIDDYGI